MIVFVTGATAGFGVAIARRFVREGHRVVGAGRRRERLDALRGELGESFVPVELDVRDRDAVQRAFATEEVDVLVNNAGLALGLEMAPSANLDDWDDMIDTNVKGLVYCTRAALPGMVARKRGHVVNIGSVAAMYPYPGGNVYGASKAFVHQFSLNLRADLLGTAVRVTDLQPGMVAGTEFSQVRFHGDNARASKVYEGIEAPLTADDVADAVHWIVTRPARVNVNVLEIMPVAQAFNTFKFDRKT